MKDILDLDNTLTNAEKSDIEWNRFNRELLSKNSNIFEEIERAISFHIETLPSGDKLFENTDTKEVISTEEYEMIFKSLLEKLESKYPRLYFGFNQKDLFKNDCKITIPIFLAARDCYDSEPLIEIRKNKNDRTTMKKDFVGTVFKEELYKSQQDFIDAIENFEKEEGFEEGDISAIVESNKVKNLRYIAAYLGIVKERDLVFTPSIGDDLGDESNSRSYDAYDEYEL